MFLVKLKTKFSIDTSDESEPSWLEPQLELKDLRLGSDQHGSARISTARLGSARDLFHFSPKSKIDRKRAEIRISVENLFLINFSDNFFLKMTELCS